jgi:hypothetical protein
LDKSNLSKILILFLLISISFSTFSCKKIPAFHPYNKNSFFKKEKIPDKKKFVGTELLCPDFITLIKNAKKDDVVKSIINAYETKTSSQSKENYTVIYLEDRSSFKFNIPPEKMLACQASEVTYGDIGQKFVYGPYDRIR